MSKKSATAKKKTVKPGFEWQTDAYERNAEFRFILPEQFLLLCKLVGVPPEEMIRDFMDNLSCASWHRKGRDEAKAHLINYFIMHGYGQHHYTEEDIRTMFKEMDALGLLFPENGSREAIDRYAAWRDEHHIYWFNKWFTKLRRNP
jgi:hypothetical protein